MSKNKNPKVVDPAVAVAKNKADELQRDAAAKVAADAAAKVAADAAAKVAADAPRLAEVASQVAADAAAKVAADEEAYLDSLPKIAEGKAICGASKRGILGPGTPIVVGKDMTEEQFKKFDSMGFFAEKEK